MAERISEAELKRDVRAVLDRVQAGAEVIVERDAQPIAILRAAEPEPRGLDPEHFCATEVDEYSRIRQAIVDSGLPLLSDDEVRAEIRERKGARDSTES